MPTTGERLIEHINKFKATPPDADSVAVLMLLMRQHTDATATSTKYKTFKLYADWSVHHQLDRADARNILKQVEEAVNIELTGGSQEIMETLLGVISMRKLQQEMIAILKESGIDSTAVNDPKQFSAIADLLIGNITDKPLALEENRLKKLFEGVAPSETTTHHIVSSLSFERRKEHPYFNIGFEVKSLPPHPFVPQIRITTRFPTAP
ncbi:MAG: hypothetical protein JWR80_2450 [Bradyrhizobium sp.]|nr:hypothetical protein [Bradyrhizobium sp.]